MRKSKKFTIEDNTMALIHLRRIENLYIRLYENITGCDYGCRSTTTERCDMFFYRHLYNKFIMDVYGDKNNQKI